MRPAPLLLGLLATAALASPPSVGPGVTALALLDVARQQGVDPRLVDVRWDPDNEKLHCLVAADEFPLHKATPFLLMADGRSTITREEVGRRIEFPVAAADFRPQIGPGSQDALRASLAELGVSEPEVGPGAGGRGAEVRARVPEAKVRELFLRASQIEGSRAWAGVRLEPAAGQVRVALIGAGQAPDLGVVPAP